jgi:hypothetical protein
MTAVELLTYLPQALKSWDTIDRFVSNGATNPILAHILNTNRAMPYGQITFNSLLRLMQNAVRTRPETRYQNWTVKKHVPPPGWNEQEKGVEVGGFRTPSETNPRKHKKWNERPESVPFKDLARGVACMPQGLDALDLTRCVEYHLAHPEEEWCYPEQFGELVEKLGGPAEVLEEHLDSRAFERWAMSRRPGGARAGGRGEVASEEDGDGSKGESDEVDDGNGSVRDASPVEVASDTDDDSGGSDDEDPGVAEVEVEQRKVTSKTEPRKATPITKPLDPPSKPEPRKATFVYDTDSEQEELRQSWKNWKEHGIVGLYIPIKKKEE